MDGLDSRAAAIKASVLDLKFAQHWVKLGANFKSKKAH
jgi:hypothetical protein